MKKLFVSLTAIGFGITLATATVIYWVYWYNEVRWVDLGAEFDGYYEARRDSKAVWGLRFVLTNHSDELLILRPTLRLRRTDGPVIEMDQIRLEPEGEWTVSPNDSSLLFLTTGFSWPEDMPKADDGPDAAERRVTAFRNSFNGIGGILLIDPAARVRANVDFEHVREPSPWSK